MFNAHVTFSGTLLTISSYDGQPYSSINPLLCRFDGETKCEYAGADLSLDFGSASFGKADDDGKWIGFIGLLRVDDTTVVPTISLTAERGLVATSAVGNEDWHVYSAAGNTGNVIIIAAIHDMERVNGLWDTTNSWIEE